MQCAMWRSNSESVKSFAISQMCFMNLFITCLICQLMFTHSQCVFGNCVMGIALSHEPYAAARITHVEMTQLRIINYTVAKVVLNHFNSIQHNYRYMNLGKKKNLQYILYCTFILASWLTTRTFGEISY